MRKAAAFCYQSTHLHTTRSKNPPIFNLIRQFTHSSWFAILWYYQNLVSRQRQRTPTCNAEWETEEERCSKLSDDPGYGGELGRIPMVPQYLTAKNLVRGLNGILLRGPSG